MEKGVSFGMTKEEAVGVEWVVEMAVKARHALSEDRTKALKLVYCALCELIALREFGYAKWAGLALLVLDDARWEALAADPGLITRDGTTASEVFRDAQSLVMKARAEFAERGSR